MAKSYRKNSRLAGQVNLLEEPLVAMITEVNMIGGSKGWWIDIEAKRHVCHDHRLFKTYNGITNTNIFLGDHYSTKVAGVEYVELRFTSGKILTLKEVFTPQK